MKVAPKSVSGRVVKISMAPVVAVDVEAHLGALGAADPLLLHGLRCSRPVEAFEVLQQAVGVGGDLEHPLAQRDALDRVAAALAEAADDLLVGEHGAERRAPVDGDLVLVGQAALGRA